MPTQILRPPPGFLQLQPSHLPLMPSLHPCTAQKLRSFASAPEQTPSSAPLSFIRPPPTLSTTPRHNDLLSESRWRNGPGLPPVDWRPPPSSRFRNAHIALDVKYDGTWRGNDERWVTGRDAEVLPNPYPHRRRDMPPESLRHSAPNGPEHASVAYSAGLLPDQSPNPERSPPVKPCGHRNPCNCRVLRDRLGIPEPPAPVAPPSPMPTPPTAGDSPSAPANSQQRVEPVKPTLLVAAKLEVARARDHLAQERRRWSRASYTPPSAATPFIGLAESSPPESTTGPAVASAAPTVADSSSASRPSPAGFPLHRTTRMAPGRQPPGAMHIRAAEAKLANAMLRLVSLLPTTDRGASDRDEASSTLVSDEESQPTVDGVDAVATTVSRPPTPHRTWVRPSNWMPHKADWPGYSEPAPWPAWTTPRDTAAADAPAGSVGPPTGTSSHAADGGAPQSPPVLSVDAAQPSSAAPPSPGSRDPDPLRLHDAELLRRYVNAELQQTSPIVLSPISPEDADTELARLLSSVLGVPCSISRRDGSLSPGSSSTSSTQGSSTGPSSLAGSRSSSLSQFSNSTDARVARSLSQVILRHAPLLRRRRGHQLPVVVSATFGFRLSRRPAHLVRCRTAA